MTVTGRRPQPAARLLARLVTFPDRTAALQQVLGCDRLDRPSVTHRLDGEAASAATGDRQDASSPDRNALHRDLREVTGPGQLEVAPAVLGKALAVEGPDHPPAAGGRSEEHTSELQSHSDVVCRLLLEKKRKSRSGIPGVTSDVTVHAPAEEARRP